ncbi:hypothetical protein ABPG75_009616 [Micractinium tetrahymenae]
MAEPEPVAAAAAGPPAEDILLPSKQQQLPSEPALPAAPLAKAEEEPREKAAAPEKAVLSPTTPIAPGVRPAAAAASPGPAVETAAAPLRRRLDEHRGLPSSTYLVMAAACLGMAVLCLAAPGLTARLMFRRRCADPIDAQHTRLLRLNGGALLVSAATSAAVASGSWGAAGQRSGDVLKLGLACQGLATKLAFSWAAASCRPLAFPLELLANGALALLPVLDLLSRRGHVGLLAELGRRVAPPQPGVSVLAGAHYLLALLLPLSGAAFFAFPYTALYHYFGYAYGHSTFLLAKLAGVADLWLIPLANLLLKDAADRGALRSRAARLLNTGQLLCAAVHIATLLPVMIREGGGWMLPVNLATWIMAFATSAAGLVVGAGAGTGAGAGGGPGEAAAEREVPAGKED